MRPWHIALGGFLVFVSGLWGGRATGMIAGGAFMVAGLVMHFRPKKP